MAKAKPSLAERQTFARQLKNQMETRGVNASQVARAIGVFPSTISRLLAAETMPNFSTLKDLAAYLQCTIEALIKE